ncbi:MAG TPA: M43 family zinc metalloprotease, partial [Flavisolibacter sp.]|nr:M43 family zinc metalloprotease [Flavisolibacter sp.]
RLEKFRPVINTRTGASGKADSHSTPSSTTTYKTEASITIPVVVHIVLPNPYLVTDADVQVQLDRLNLDYSGLNPDSTNEPAAFLAARGHSQIQFCLAKRTPSGTLTSGIERRASLAGSNLSLPTDPIKSAAAGGLDGWDPTQYLNLWVGDDVSGSGILGYASFPGDGSGNDDGVFLNYVSFATNSCYVDPSYNKGRTATHEVGHYFGLYHIWGDDDGCAGDDFRQLPGVIGLPAGLFNPDGLGNTAADIGDTPNQGSESSSCLFGIVTDACATASPGKMYQNYMDYTFDACYSLFTRKQVERMEWVLNNARGSLKTSLGCQPPAGAIALDAAPFESVNPGGYEIVGCATRVYGNILLCPGTITPKVRIVNNGLTPLTSVKVGYRLDNGAAVSQTATVSLQLGSSTVISLPSLNLPEGVHQIKFFTSNPNGSTDQVPSNDTLSRTITVNGSVSGSLVETFQGATFPPAGWSVFNPDGSITWQRNSLGNRNPGSAYINTFNYTANDAQDALITPRVSYSDADSVKLTFDVAAATFSDPRTPGITLDTLEIQVTKDCGNTFQTVYKKWGESLRTLPTPTEDEYFPSGTAQWRKDTVDLTAYAAQSPIQLLFIVTNNFENNIFIDNVNLTVRQVPARLKEEGLLILPNPFRTSFAVWHYQQPVTLRYLNVYNAAGQLVWTKGYNRNAEKYITIDLSSQAPGVYFVQLDYLDENLNVRQKLIKY